MPLKAQEWGMTTPPVCLAYVINLICIHWVNCGYGTLFITQESGILLSLGFNPFTGAHDSFISITIWIPLKWILLWPPLAVGLTNVLSELDNAGVIMQVGLNGTTHDDIKLSCTSLPFSSCAATGPDPQAGRPLQGPGVLHRDPPMDGTWAPIERGVTATSSKCPVFKETEGGSYSVPDV